MLFGTAIIIIAFTYWFAENSLVIPINSMTKSADEFAFSSPDNLARSTELIKSLNIKTGNEIEDLYHALTKTVTDVIQYITIIDDMQNSIIISFANMVESRDANTGEHVKHTAAYVGIIAEQMKADGSYPEILTDDFIRKAVRSAPLHDVGKIKVPDSILNKPGKLTKEEFDIMKTHTTAGKEILNDVISNSPDGSYLLEGINMAAYHYERWDGGGYPEGLAGDAIPLSARIMAVADVYDALISKRSYKDAMPAEKARDIIIEESDSHFDPTVVKAFTKAFERIKAVSEPQSSLKTE